MKYLHRLVPSPLDKDAPFPAVLSPNSCLGLQSRGKNHCIFIGPLVFNIHMQFFSHWKNTLKFYYAGLRYQYTVYSLQAKKFASLISGSVNSACLPTGVRTIWIFLKGKMCERTFDSTLFPADCRIETMHFLLRLEASFFGIYCSVLYFIV